MREYLLCLFVAASVTYLVTPLARRFAIAWGAMAEVRDRDVHDEPTPRLGGLGMAAGLIAAMLVASQLPLTGIALSSGERGYCLAGRHTRHRHRLAALGAGGLGG